MLKTYKIARKVCVNQDHCVSTYMQTLIKQWRSQGHSLAGGGQNASAEGASHARGVRGHAPPENFEI